MCDSLPSRRASGAASLIPVIVAVPSFPNPDRSVAGGPKLQFVPSSDHCTQQPAGPYVVPGNPEPDPEIAALRTNTSTTLTGVPKS